MVEMAIVASLLFIVVLGFVDFGYAFYQWNAANKAVQAGARLASISNPVAVNLPDAVDDAHLPATRLPGDDVASGAYDYVCDGASFDTENCNSDAFNLIYAGDDGVCGGTANPGRPGMCDFFPRLEKKNVKIEYVATGLGYWTRPGGPVPTIKVSLQNLTFQFYFLGGLLGFNDIDIPSMVSTVTGEDLDSSSP